GSIPGSPVARVEKPNRRKKLLVSSSSSSRIINDGQTVIIQSSATTSSRTTAKNKPNVKKQSSLDSVSTYPIFLFRFLSDCTLLWRSAWNANDSRRKLKTCGNLRYFLFFLFLVSCFLFYLCYLFRVSRDMLRKITAEQTNYLVRKNVQNLCDVTLGKLESKFH